VSLRDEFEKLFVHKGESCADAPDKWAWTIRGSFPIEVWSWLEQKLAEAQAEMVERCAEALGHLAAELRIVKDGVSADLAADAIQESTEVIRALSPDSPDSRWLKRKLLEARLETAERIEGLCMTKTVADAKALHDYIAGLRRQLTGLAESKK